MEAYEIIVVAFLLTFVVSIFLGYPIAWTLGGLSLLFVATSDEVFGSIVPWLILVSALLLALQDRMRAWLARRGAVGQSR